MTSTLVAARYFLVLAILACWSTLPDQLLAQVVIDRAVITMKHGARPIENVIVRNSGEETLYITSHADVMIAPGTPQELRQTTDELLVSPKRFALAGGEQRAVRLLHRRSSVDHEKVYRVKFMPELRGFDDEQKGGAAEKRALLKVLSGMGLLLLVEPAQPTAKLTWTSKDDALKFLNEGNVNIFLDEGNACLTSGGDCTRLGATRLYPGNTFSVSAPSGATVTYRKESLGSFEVVTIPPQP